jgi:hypothetical protein
VPAGSLRASVRRHGLDVVLRVSDRRNLDSGVPAAGLTISG